MATIGFIGLGHMGNPMVRNLMTAGHDLLIYDLRPEACEELVKEGAVTADTLKELAAKSDVIITMVQTSQQVEEICLAPDGLFKNAKTGVLYIDCSSIDVAVCREIHLEAKNSGIAMVDAPVSGGVSGAAAATLTIMVGGDVDNFDKAKPILAALGKTIIHAGPAGNGQVAKICNNMILGVSMIAVSEAFTLGEKLGLDPKKFFEISSQSSGECWSMTKYNPVPGVVEGVPANNEYQPGFTARMMLKDLQLSQEAAKIAGASTPLGSEATALYSMFVNQTKGELDFSGIIKLFASVS